jgi:hypothetical protein
VCRLPGQWHTGGRQGRCVSGRGARPRAATARHMWRGPRRGRPTADDQDITTSDTTIPSIDLQGLIMTSQAQQLRHQVNLFLCSSANDLENRLLPNDLIVIRNQVVGHDEHVRHQEGVGEPRKHA